MPYTQVVLPATEKKLEREVYGALLNKVIVFSSRRGNGA
jgi:hypothetical protein